MKIEQRVWQDSAGWYSTTSQRREASPVAPQLVLLFGATAIIGREDLRAEIRRSWPDALMVGCSTAGEICGVRVFDDSLSVTAIEFEHSRIAGKRMTISSEGSRQTGEELARSLDHQGLVHVFVLSEGINVNGSELVEGLVACLPPGVTATGGLSGDGSQMAETLVAWDDELARDMVAAVGFYGERLRVGYGSLGGWDPFGPERLVTRSAGNVLYELDGRSALELYKNYLGDHAADLPVVEREGAEVLGDQDDRKTLVFIGAEGTRRHDHAGFETQGFAVVVELGHEHAVAHHHALDMEIVECALHVGTGGIHVWLLSGTWITAPLSSALPRDTMPVSLWRVIQS